MEAFKKRVFWLLGLLLLLALLYLAREALVVVFVAFIFTSALLPMVEKLDVRLPRWLAVMIPFAIMLVVVVGVVIPVLSLAIQQLQLFLNDLPAYLDQAMAWLNQWAFIGKRYKFLANLSPDVLLEQLSLQNAMVFSGFTSLTMAVSQVSVDLLSALVISIFLLLDRERIQRYLLHFWPPESHARLNALIEDLIRSTGAFVNGQLLFIFFVGSLISVGLHWIGLPFAILLGFLAGVLTIIPIIGPNIAMIPTLLIALLMPGGGWSALWVFILFVVVQVIANNFIGPLIMGRAVGLHPLAILLAILFGGMMFGMVGIILAIPVAACLHILLRARLHPESNHPACS